MLKLRTSDRQTDRHHTDTNAQTDRQTDRHTHLEVGVGGRQGDIDYADGGRQVAVDAEVADLAVAACLVEEEAGLQVTEDKRAVVQRFVREGDRRKKRNGRRRMDR
jgi:hypothetical protein